MQLQFRPDNDDRTARIIDPFAQQILAEAPLLALEHVGKRLQGPFVGTGDRAAAPPVVEQRVDRLLQHALFVADNDIGGPQFNQPLEAIVAVDHPPIEIIEIGSRKTPAIQRHQRPQFGRDDRDDLEDHPFGLVLGTDKGLDDFKPLDDLERLQRGLGLGQLDQQLFAFALEIDGQQKLFDRLGADAGGKAVFAIFVLGPQVIFLRQQLKLLERRQTRLDDHIVLEIENPLQILQGHIEQQSDAARQGFEEPDMGHRSGQFDMAHALAPDL